MGTGYICNTHIFFQLQQNLIGASIAFSSSCMELLTELCTLTPHLYTMFTYNGHTVYSGGSSYFLE